MVEIKTGQWEVKRGLLDWEVRLSTDTEFRKFGPFFSKKEAEAVRDALNNAD